MQNSLYDRTAAFLRNAEGTGLLAELESKVENQHTERRKVLIARLKELPAARAKEMKPFEGVGEKLSSEVHHLADALAAAKAKLMEHIQRTSVCTTDSEEIAIRKELAKTVPEFVRDTWLRLDFLNERLIMEIDYDISRIRGITGLITTKYFSNVDEISALRAHIQAAKATVEEMITTAHDVENMRAECARLVAECREKSMQFADHPRDLRPDWDTNND